MTANKLRKSFNTEQSKTPERLANTLDLCVNASI